MPTRNVPATRRAAPHFFAGEAFTDLADAQHRAEHWCTATAGVRLHGTTYQRPAEQFAAEEQQLLLPAPQDRYDVPIFATPKVARDLHIQVVRGLYSVPAELVGQRVDVRADTRLVKVFSRGQYVVALVLGRVDAFYRESKQSGPRGLVGMNTERHRIRPGHGEHPETTAQR